MLYDCENAGCCLPVEAYNYALTPTRILFVFKGERA